MDIAATRYEELVRKEEELRLLKKALREQKYISEIDNIKRLFNISSESEDKTNED